jgi:hypothetical protein
MTLMTTAVASMVLEGKNHYVNNQLLGCGPYIQAFRETTYLDLLACNEVVPTFALWIGESTGLLGAPLQDISLYSPGNPDPSAGCDQQGASAVVAAEKLLRGDTTKTDTTSIRSVGSDWTVGIGFFVGKLFTTRPCGLFLSSYFLSLPPYS